ncbi:MAG: hypothetical protein JW908_00660 [Anaerolineales bacterium]|nr:hypothetical protein [Anaerolineales bacterium]
MTIRSVEGRLKQIAEQSVHTPISAIRFDYTIIQFFAQMFWYLKTASPGVGGDQGCFTDNGV